MFVLNCSNHNITDEICFITILFLGVYNSLLPKLNKKGYKICFLMEMLKNDVLIIF